MPSGRDVAATLRASFVLAPGGDAARGIYSTGLNLALGEAQVSGITRASDYLYQSGTSMAAPHVSGVAALVWQTNPSLTAEQVKSIVRGGASRYGYPVLDAEQAVRASLASRAAPVVTGIEASAFVVDELVAITIRGSDFPPTTRLVVRPTNCLDWQLVSQRADLVVGRCRAHFSSIAIEVASPIDGSALARRSFAGSTSVVLPSTQPQITAALVVTPNPAVVGDVVTVVAPGINLRNSGFLFKGLDFCGEPIARPSTVTDAELLYRCVATVPTNLIGTVSVVAADTISQNGAVVIVRVNCPGGQALDTGAGRCVATAGPIDLLATSFVRGENVALSTNGYGLDTLMTAPPYVSAPNAAEWDFTVPAAGTYELFVEYAALESRPVVVSFNGVVRFNNALPGATGGWFPRHRQVLSQGTVQLAAGATTMRLSRSDAFPHIKGFRLVPTP